MNENPREEQERHETFTGSRGAQKKWRQPRSHVSRQTLRELFICVCRWISRPQQTNSLTPSLFIYFNTQLQLDTHCIVPSAAHQTGGAAAAVEVSSCVPVVNSTCERTALTCSVWLFHSAWRVLNRKCGVLNLTVAFTRLWLTSRPSQNLSTETLVDEHFCQTNPLNDRQHDPKAEIREDLQNPDRPNPFTPAGCFYPDKAERQVARQFTTLIS